MRGKKRCCGKVPRWNERRNADCSKVSSHKQPSHKQPATVSVSQIRHWHGTCDSLKHSPEKYKLLTDGENNAGDVDPIQAAELAETLGVKIYTIGVGTKGQAPVPVTDPFTGRKVMRWMEHGGSSLGDRSNRLSQASRQDRQRRSTNRC
jgi:hypothetical protein